MKLKKVLLVLLCMFICLTGCGNKSEETEGEGSSPTVALVIIAGRHANAKIYTEKMIDRGSEYIERSWATEKKSDEYIATAQISVIVCDGNPEKVNAELDGDDILTCKANNRGKLDEKKEKLVSNLTKFLMSPSLKADDEEVDLLLAISRAQDILEEYPDCEHHILILDTGITTAGYLDMNKIDILSSDCSEIIEKIKPGLPDLDQTEVTFMGLGNVAFPQRSVTSTEGKEKIEELWARIIEESNGTLTPDCLNYNDTENSEEMVFSEDNEKENDGTGYKYVSSVLFYSSGEDNVEPNPLEIKEEESDEPIVTLCFQTSDLGGFVPDKAEFLNKNVAVSTLNKMSGDLNEFLEKTDKKLYVIGSIAKTSPDNNMARSDVSKGRAQLVADLLIDEYHVPESRIELVDAGTTQFSWRNAEEFPDGIYDRGAAQKNRVVAIISENSTLTDELRPDYIK